MNHKLLLFFVFCLVLSSAVFARKSGKSSSHADDDKSGAVDDDKADGAVVEPVVNTCNTTCLTLVASDFYGDGWDSVQLHSEVEGGASWAMAPDCFNKKVQAQFCPEEDGTYYFTAIHSNASYIPENYWEIIWTATSHNCDGSVANTFTGGFNSSLIMDYVGNEWSVQYWENLWDNEKQCDACGDAQMCAPKKPKNKAKGKGGRGGNKPGRGRGGGGKALGGGSKSNDDGSGSGSNDDYASAGDDDRNSTMSGGDDDRYLNFTMGNDDRNTTGSSNKKRYGPPAVNVRVTMFDEHGDGWWKTDYSGESWYLADDRREKLFHTGTLCDGNIGACNLCLGDGSYTMRFTGVNNNFTAWDFCGVTGHRGAELTFHVLKGQCYADSVVAVETDCEGVVETVVSLTGVVAVSGFSSEIIAEGSYDVLATTLAAMVQGWEAKNIKIIGTTLDSRAESSRRLSDFTQDFTFVVTFIAEEAFGIDGRSHANLENLATSLATTLSNKMSSGMFETTLQLQMALNSVVALAPTSTAELLSLELGSVSFIGGETIVPSTLPEPDFSVYETEKVVSAYNLPSLTAFFGVALLGFVAFVGIVRQTMTAPAYESLPDDSVRAADVQESEMETSNSPMIKTAFQVETTPTSLKL